MSIREKNLEELELMSYTDIAYEIIKEDKKAYNTPNLFKEVSKLLQLSEAEFEEKEDSWGHAVKQFVCWNLRDE